MSTPFRVAVSQRVDVLADRGERRDAVDQRLMTFLLAAGLLPIPAPNALFTGFGEQSRSRDRFNEWLSAVGPHAVVLSGGNDIGECLERDRTESNLLDYAQAQRLPVLGICRGMQMMAVRAGATLVATEGHVGTRHRLLPVEGYGRWPDEVNSFHNFGLADCPRGYVVMARTENGTIEAMRHENLPWEAWMWHPERDPGFSSIDLNRLKALFLFGQLDT